MKQAAFETKNIYTRNVFHEHRNLIYLTAATVGSIAGIVVGEKPSPSGRTPVLPQLSPPFLTSNSSPTLKGLTTFRPAQALQQLDVSLKQQTKIIQEGVNFTAPLQFQGKVVNSVSTNHKVIALTFDDGPWNNTPKVLDILKANQIKATFFMVGKHIQAYPQVVKQVVAEGHAVGNHTWNHRYGNYSPATAAMELQKTSDLLSQVSGVKTTLFRPPGGILNNGLAGYVQSQKGTVVMWSNDSLDWRSPSAQTITNNVLKNVRAGGIILLHDGGGDRSGTIAALPGIIRELKKQGYEFVTVPQLLEIKNQELQAKKG